MYVRRSYFKWIIGAITFLVLVILGYYLVFGLAAYNISSGKDQVRQIALTKSSLKTVDTYYHLNRGVNSYAVAGNNQKGQRGYFIYLPNSKKAYYLLARKGYSQSRILARFSRLHPVQKINKINLGWYKGEAVWEITYIKSNGKYGYAIYSFNKGKELSYIDNL